VSSLRARMVVVASVVLAAFLGLTAVALEAAFRDTGLELVRERLQAHVYALLAAAELAADGSLALDAPAEPRFVLPDSGLYAAVRETDGRTLWRSPSLLDRELPALPAAPAGEPRFSRRPAPWGEELFTLSFRVRWELPRGGERVLDLHVGESRSDFDARVAHFRRELWLRLAALAAGLLAAQALVLTLGLAPLRRLARELREIESGAREHLSEDQPRELRALAANMNHLIDFGRRAVERNRNALADLAHALKTPLAVLRGAAEDAPASPPALRATVLECVTRMDEALRYRLRRASAAGGTTLGPALRVRVLAERLRETFRKVHAEKAPRIDLDVDPALAVRADEGDLTEILGNLLDNACKWSRAAVRLSVRAGAGRGVVITVEDDGPGIPAAQRERILERGVRADEHVPGHGLGLALVRELATEHYAGNITVDDAPGGGARITVHLDVARR